MNISELKPGDYIRITASETGCDGCVLKMDECNEKCLDEYLLLSVIRANHVLCSGASKSSCRVYADEKIEILTPEQVMEIELSR